jgi:hypothetical protein
MRFAIRSKADMLRGAVLGVVLCVATGAATLPAGTRLEIRLQSRVASDNSRPKDAVAAALIRVVAVDGQIVVPAGVAVAGEVVEAKPAGKPDERAGLELRFTRLGETKIESRVVAVDNARESVEASGRIVGILPSETLVAQLNRGVESVSKKYGKLGGFLGAVSGAVFREPEPEIIYEPGVELAIELTEPARWKGQAEAPAIAAVEPEEEIYRIVNSQPVQTTAADERKTPSDLTTLMFVGGAEQLAGAFKAAGWATAAELNAMSGIEVARAVAESRGYKEAPMSTLLLDGAKPDAVFQKQNNTFAMRHHLRIWKRPAEFGGRTVWVCAATHDIGIEFSPEKRNFIHKIDPEIDRERAKVVSDLLLTDRVAALALVPRPDAPQHSQNATGDKLETDGAMAVLELR